ncbi:MAG TPA: TetR/AcrR family transcriptional regulator [Oculatellaceae cyanobacterium]
MTRSKNFTREEVLEKAVPLFWKKGFAETSVHDLEIATGVNKSGLYSEFASKEDLYLATLSHYLTERGRTDWLSDRPLGWRNIERYLNHAEYYTRDLRGCLMVYAIREIPLLSKQAQKILADYHAEVRARILENVVAEKPKGDASKIADMIMLLFSGIAIMQNIRKRNDEPGATAKDFMNVLKKL